MIQEQKQLLLKDLCARIPYTPLVLLNGKEHCLLTGIDGEKVYLNTDSEPFDLSESNIKPYLRPMSSMTEEEKDYLKNNFHFYFDECSDGVTNGLYSATFNRTVYQMVNENDISDITDWLNAHNFDYRGLIEKGLALGYKEE